MKKIMLIVLVIICAIGAGVFFWYKKYDSTGKVEEKAYDMMLAKMLKHDVPEITVTELAPNFQQYQLFDTRSEKEFKVSHLPGAVWLTDDKTKQVDAANAFDKERPTIIYCSVGYRSEKAAARLREAGFKKVYNLYGGIFEWSNQGKPMVGIDGSPTKAVHGYNLVWAKWIRNGELKLD